MHAAVRFTKESIDATEPELVRHSSSIGEVILHPSRDHTDPPAAGDTGLPPACADFGMLKEGHTWCTAAGAVPAGSRIDTFAPAQLIQEVRLAPAEQQPDEDGMAVDADTLSLLVTIRPEAPGEFDEKVTVQLVGQGGATQALVVRAHGQVMSAEKGTPMARHGVHCLDPA